MNDLDTVAPGSRKARVEIIPLIDVIFFLLATFVLFTLTLHRVTVLEANLPAGASEGREEDTTAFIQAAEGGALYWKVGSTGPVEPVTLAELSGMLERYKQQVALPRVMVRSDGKAKLGVTVAVLDEVRRARIREVAVETRPSLSGM